MNSIPSSPRAKHLFVTSIIARLPLAMLDIALLVRAWELTGSLAQASLVAGAHAVALGIGGPVLGRIVDRRGQRVVLVVGAGTAAVLLIAIGVVPAGVPLPVLVGLAAGIGLAAPPVGACLRAALPGLLSTTADLRRVYVLEASLLELTYIAGPPLALCIAAWWSGGAPLAFAGVLLLVATLAFALLSGSVGRVPAPTGRPGRSGALGAPAVRTLVVVLAGVGMLLGAAEVGVIAAAAGWRGGIGAAPMFAVWGLGSFLGGLFAARFGGGPGTARGLALLLAALTVGHLALIPAERNAVTLGAVLFLAGAAIAPIESALSAMVDAAAPAGAVTEAFAWLATAVAVGSALGAAGAGIAADQAGPSAAFALAGLGGVLAALAATLRSATLTRAGVAEMDINRPSRVCPAPSPAAT